MGTFAKRTSDVKRARTLSRPSVTFRSGRKLLTRTEHIFNPSRNALAIFLLRLLLLLLLLLLLYRRLRGLTQTLRRISPDRNTAYATAVTDEIPTAVDRSEEHTSEL